MTWLGLQRVGVIRTARLLPVTRTDVCVRQRRKPRGEEQSEVELIECEIVGDQVGGCQGCFAVLQAVTGLARGSAGKYRTSWSRTAAVSPGQRRLGRRDREDLAGSTGGRRTAEEGQRTEVVRRGGFPFSAPSRSGVSTSSTLQPLVAPSWHGGLLRSLSCLITNGLLWVGWPMSCKAGRGQRGLTSNCQSERQLRKDAASTT